jgi:hypothetical protein
MMNQQTSDAVRSSTDPVGIRESMRRLPDILALPLTLLTGKPHAGQRPIHFTPSRHLTNALLSVCSGLVLSSAGLTLGGWRLILLAPGWAMTLHGVRNLRMMVFHQCAHRNMWGHPVADAFVGKAISALLLIQNFDGYSKEHVVDHHAVHHMSLRDPTVQAFLVALGLRPGMSRAQMWRRVIGRLVSPAFHLRFLSSRVRSFWWAASRVERVMALCVLLAAVLASVFGAGRLVLVAWVIPMTVPYQISNTLRLCVKHTFPAADSTERRGREYFAGLTNAVFLGELAPSADLPTARRMVAWAHWWLRMLSVHFLSRYLVLTGDTVCHDFHHRHPMSRKWANYIFEREADARSGANGWPEYREVWALVPAINAVFDSLAKADPGQYDVRMLRGLSRHKVFAAFDD